MSQHIIVCLTQGECEEYPGLPCVLEALGPYETREEARELFDGLRKAGNRPHWIPLDNPEIYAGLFRDVAETYVPHMITEQ